MSKRGLILLVTILAFCSTSHAEQISISAQGQDDLIGAPLSGEGGAWRTRVQQLFEPSNRSLIRKAITVWQSVPQGDFDFEWVPADLTAISAGRANGLGELIWRDRTKPSYDDTAVVAKYRGALADGKMHGAGRFVDRKGLNYEGQWSNGLMNGQGRLRLPGGAEYEGQFRNGLADGSGRLVDATGERYEGDFKAGLRHGAGTTMLPNGRSYPSRWANGHENERSRLVRIAQSGGKLPGADDIRIGIGVDQKLPPLGVGDNDGKIQPRDLAYKVVNDAAAFRIRPSSTRLMEMWLGKGDLQLTWEEEADPESQGVVSVAKTQIVPLKLRIEVDNRSGNSVQLNGLYLDVEKSTVERKPALQIGVGGISVCEAEGYAPRFRIENFGWAKAETTKMRLATTQTSGSGSFSYGLSIGDIDEKAVVDLEPVLKSAGVDTGYLASLKDGFPCEAKNKGAADACLKRLQATGKLGKISKAVEVKQISFRAKFSGRVEYSWHDTAGEKHDWSSPFNAVIPLGHFKYTGECGEFGRAQVISNKTQQFKLNQSNYRMPVSFQTTIARGQKSILLIPVEALQSSTHVFKVVLQLSNGGEVSSRPIELLYYRPKWFKNEDGDDDNSSARIENRELIGAELRELKTSDSEECEKACDEQSTCLGYSVNRDAKTCSLKSSVTAERLDITYTSKLKKGPRPPELSSAKTMELHQNTSTGGAESAYLLAVDSSVEDCQRICMTDGGCVSFGFEAAKRLCYFMPNVGELTNNPNFISGIKRQAKP